MSGLNGSHSHLQDLEALADLPASDPLRHDFTERLRTASPAESQRLTSLLQQTDRLQNDLLDVTIPTTLMERLLTLPDAPPETAATRPSPRPFLSPFAWRAAAACLILALGLLTYFLWPHGPISPVDLSPEMRQTLAKAAIENAAATPAIISANPTDLQSKLQAAQPALAVQVLTPNTPLDLKGGGLCTIAGAKAVFTRWQLGARVYTLFQFDGANVGIPGQFLRITDTAAKDYNVVLFPGKEGKCTWALVMEKTASVDPFNNY